MLSNISDLFTMASLVICMLLSGIIFYYLRTRISMLEQSVMDQAQLLQQVVASLKSSSSQYRQQMNANVNVVSAQQHQDLIAESSEMKMNLIQVSDDSESDSSDDSDDSDDYESDDDESGNGNVCTIKDGSCKIIDLSTISSSANYLKPSSSSSHSEIKVIELKSNIRSNQDYVDEDDEEDEDEDEEDEDDDEDDEEDEEDEEDDDDEEYNDVNENHDEKNIERKNNDTDNQGNQGNQGNQDSVNDVNVNIKKTKSIVIEDVTSSVSLDEMKNMPVNSLRSLAKTKLSNIDVPTINKMSKKDILKAIEGN